MATAGKPALPYSSECQRHSFGNGGKDADVAKTEDCPNIRAAAQDEHAIGQGLTSDLLQQQGAVGAIGPVACQEQGGRRDSLADSFHGLD